MTPVVFDRMMIEIEIGSNLKVARLSDREFRCLVCGVWPVAAKANPRGYLSVIGEPATAADVAHQARVSVADARKTLARLRSLRMLELHEDVGLEYCHDWHLINPDPKPDPTATERQRRHRERLRNGNVTRDSHAEVPTSVTAVTPPEVKEKEKGKNNSNSNAELYSAVVECFTYWQRRCNHSQALLSSDRRSKIDTRIRERARPPGGIPGAIRDIRQAIDGAALAPYIDEKGKRFDDIELICRTNSKLEDFMGRANAPVVSIGSGRKPSTSDLVRKLRENEESV